MYLDVSVYDSLGVAVLHTAQDLLDALGRITLAVELSGHYVIKQFPTSDQVKDHIAHMVLLVDMVHPNYIQQ